MARGIASRGKTGRISANWTPPLRREIEEPQGRVKGLREVLIYCSLRAQPFDLITFGLSQENLSNCRALVWPRTFYLLREPSGSDSHVPSRCAVTYGEVGLKLRYREAFILICLGQQRPFLSRTENRSLSAQGSDRAIYTIFEIVSGLRRGHMVCELLTGRTHPRQLSCGHLDRLALLLFGIEDFNLEIWEAPL